MSDDTFQRERVPQRDGPAVAISYGFVVVEDDPDMQVLISMLLRRDLRMGLLGQASSAESALALLSQPGVQEAFRSSPGVIILDHGIEGDVMGLDAAPLLKAKAPAAKILLFSAFDLASEAARDPAVDDYLRKDQVERLLPRVQRLLGLDERRLEPRAASD